MSRSVLTLVLLTSPILAADFHSHTIATGLKGGYQVVPVDMNHDGKIDLIALASGMTELVWYENPTWERHVIAGNLPRMINVAAWDTDGDGIPELVVASEFSNQAANSVGILSLLTHNGDPRQPWTIREIDRIPTSHRLRWADIDGSGKKVVVNAPLTGAKAEAPDNRDHVPLVYYKPGEWKRRVINEANEGVVHGILVADWDKSGRDSILTASFLGVHAHRWNGSVWQRTEISAGDPSPWPKSGSSDIAIGNTNGVPFLAAIEPWHGNQVVVYRKGNGKWVREKIDDSLVDGHTIATADLEGGGNQQIIAGYRGKPYRVYLYKYAGGKWNRQTLDEDGMAAAACAVADLNGDGKADIACIGSATQNLKWYENVTGK